MDDILTVQSVSKKYPTRSGSVSALENVTFSLRRSATCAVVGPSGSGKTTLLALCAGLDRPSGGKVLFDGSDLGTLNEDALARLRNERIGFVFQNFQLMIGLTALENVMIPLELQGVRDAEQRARAALAEVGLAERETHYPLQLSGGEQQRVAVARAYVSKPTLLFADEPTGNLDAASGEQIMNLLFELNRSHGTALLLVTHNLELAARCEYIIRLRAGAVEQNSSVRSA